jgi:hypothetical protein
LFGGFKRWRQHDCGIRQSGRHLNLMKRPVSGAVEAKCLRQWLERTADAMKRVGRFSEAVPERRQPTKVWSELKEKRE